MSRNSAQILICIIVYIKLTRRMTIVKFDVLVKQREWHAGDKKSGARSDGCITCYSHCYVTWFLLTTGIAASQYPSREHPPPEITKIGIFECCKSDVTTMKRLTMNLQTWLKVMLFNFGNNRPLNLTEMAPVIGIEGTVSRARLWCTRDYIDTGHM